MTNETIRILKLAIEDSKEHIRFCFDSRGIEALNMAIKALELQQGWIPVSERLPEEDGEYFVSVRYKYVKGYESVCTEYGEWNDGSWIYDPEYCGEAEGIIAWMPLPEPHKEDTEDDK